MKRILLSLLAPVAIGGMYTSAFAQTEPAQPCCSIIARDIKKNLVIARDNGTGQLTCFKTDNLDIKAVSKGDAVTINLQSKKITGIGGAIRNYNIIQPDNAEPVNILATLRIDNADPISGIVTPKVNNAEPITGIVNNKLNPLEPCCGIVSIQPDPLDPCCAIVSFKNNSTGVVSKFQVPKNISSSIKVGNPVYSEPVNGIRINYAEPISGMKINNAEPINEFAIVQSSYGSSNGQMASYGYPASSGNGAGGNANDAAKWVITPVPAMKGVLGKLNTKFSEDADWSIDVRTAAENKFITNRSSYSKHGPMQDIAPGTYNFQLNTILVENVPIEKGKETRLKAGFLNIVSEGVWQLYDETQKIFHTSGNKPKKIVLPIGSYQLKLGGQFFPVVIKDKETVEY